MAKAKPSVPNRHIYSRASYMYQAAHYLATAPRTSSNEPSTSHEHSAANDVQQQQQQQQQMQTKAALNLSRQLISDMKSVTLKTLIRQSPAMKRSVCRFCSTVQIEGETCHSWVQNASKGGSKPWADVLVIRCSTCQNVKRYPVDCPRQKRRHLRGDAAAAAPATTETAMSERNWGHEDADPQPVDET